jgi:membrane fusion protein, copper/silver efflux system
MRHRLFSRTNRTLSRLLPLVLVILAIGLVVACQGGQGTGAQLYHCPMQPDYVSDKPGDCPICGMRLVPFGKASGRNAKPTPGSTAAVSTAAALGPVVYTCPMHPQIRQAKPGTCPICQMDLVPVKAPAPSEHAHGGADAQGSPAQPGDLSLTAEQVKLAGVQTVVAVEGQVSSTIRAVGTVAVDDTRVREITTKVSGFVEKLYVNAEGQTVAAGQPLFELYSPELLASQEEFLRARQTAAVFQKSALPEVQQGGQDLASAARRRLELFDVPSEFIERLESTGKAERRVVFHAPFSGIVTAKGVLEGQKVEAGANLLTLTDLSRVWVLAQVYEAEASAAKVGRAGIVTLPYDPNIKLAGRVAFVYPTLDTETRTLKVRLEFANPRLLLKPGMFVNVELATDQARGLVVPDSAIIDSGTRQVVFVQSGDGQFAVRDVRVSARGNGQAVITAGLAAGARVAVSANFLLDSESRLRTAINGKTNGEVRAPEHKH